MGSGRKFIPHWSGALIASQEPLPGLSVIEIYGNKRILIEGHRGILQYHTEEISVKVSYGNILVTGNGLHLKHMTCNQLVISGKIFDVHLVSKEHV